jgi:AraC family transcriptional regulator
MRAESVLRTVSSAIGARADGVFALNVPSDLNRSQPSAASASERIGHLVRRAMLFLESDREAARRCLNDASALLGSEVQHSRTSATLANHDILPGGLARWQVKRVLAYIEVKLGSKMGAVELADLVAFSASHFSRAFKRSLGLPPMAYVASRRVERAKTMMISTRQQLSEIALACGFADQAHLNRSFRRWVGVSPGQWRRVNAETVKSIAPLRD